MFSTKNTNNQNENGMLQFCTLLYLYLNSK